MVTLRMLFISLFLNCAVVLFLLGHFCIGENVVAVPNEISSPIQRVIENRLHEKQNFSKDRMLRTRRHSEKTTNDDVEEKMTKSIEATTNGTEVGTPVTTMQYFLEASQEFSQQNFTKYLLEEASEFESTNDAKKLTRRLTTTKMFLPLMCNRYLEQAPCELFSAQRYIPEKNEVYIPCGKCVTMGEFVSDKSENHVLRFPHGLNIEGKMLFPDGTKVTIYTKHIFVQGVLSMRNSDFLRGSGHEHVKIIMTGTEDVLFTPHPRNRDICGDSGCNFGPKAVVVAGGQLDIMAIRDGCPAWIRPQRSSIQAGEVKYSFVNDAVSNTTSLSPGGICHNLALNPEIDGKDYTAVASTVHRIVDGIDGQYVYVASKRSMAYSGITWDLDQYCARAGATYRFSMRIALISQNTSPITVQLLTTNSAGSSRYQTIASCMSKISGWLYCESLFTFSNVHESARKITVLFRIAEETRSTVLYKNINFEYVSGGNVDATMTPAEAIADCWKPGTEIAVTSNNFYHDESVFDAVSSIDSTGMVFSGRMATREVFTAETGGDVHSTEFIALSRNVVFTTDDPANRIGGHFLILTPQLSQRIEGLALEGFGQEGYFGRYPINIKMCDSIPGTRVTKNLIRDSNSRCIVISGSHDILVANNAAINNIGHCYDLEDGSETNNRFIENIAAITLRPSIDPPGEKDGRPASFHITNPQNVYKSNVAAGSYEYGFWLDCEPVVVGNSASLYADLNPQTMALSLFDSNEAHSCRGSGMKVSTYSPGVKSIMSNSKVYRNQNFGMLVDQSTNLVISNGQFSDNLYGIDVDRSGDIVLEDSTVVGHSLAYRNGISSDYERHCSGVEKRFHQVGLMFHASVFGDTSGNVTLSNVQFVNYGDSTGCLGSVAIEVSDDAWNTNFEPDIQLLDVTFDNSEFTSSSTVAQSLDSAPKLQSSEQDGGAINLCSAIGTNIKDIFIYDSGSLNPSQGGSLEGTIVSDTESTAEFITSNKCVSMGSGSCAQYCTGEDRCNRVVQIALSVHDTSDVKVVIQDVASGEVITLEDGVFEHVNQYQDRLWTARRIFQVMLPNKSNLKATIARKTDDTAVWPAVVELIFGEEPFGCADFLRKIDLYEPPLEKEQCHHLIQDGSFEQGDISSVGWYHNGAGLTMTKIPGENSVFSWALSTLTRIPLVEVHGLVYFLDTRCFEVGDIVQVEAEVRMTNRQGIPTGCDYTIESGKQKCPSLSVITVNNGARAPIEWDFGVASEDWLRGAWNDVNGRFLVSSEIATAEGVAILLSRTSAEKIILGQVSAKVFKASCDNMVMNGDFNHGDLYRWRAMGSNTLVRLMPDNTAVVFNRNGWYDGISQTIRPECLVEGDTFEIHAKIRLGNAKGMFTCNPERVALSYDRCPNISLKYEDSEGKEYFTEIGHVVGPYHGNRMNTIYGIFTVTKEMEEATNLVLYVSNAAPGIRIILDDIRTVRGTDNSYGMTDCSQLVSNHDAERGDTMFWRVNGPRSVISLTGGGFQGSKHAFRLTNRSFKTSQMYQAIDPTCMIPESKWLVEAYVQLGTKWGSFACDKRCNSGSRWCEPRLGACPEFNLLLQNPGEPIKYYLLRNFDKSQWRWDGYHKVASVFFANDVILSYENVYISLGLGVKEDIDIIVDHFTVKRLG